jgi:hypothetical protein
VVALVIGTLSGSIADWVVVLSPVDRSTGRTQRCSASARTAWSVNSADLDGVVYVVAALVGSPPRSG